MRLFGFVSLPVLIFAFVSLFGVSGWMYFNYNQTWESDSQVATMNEMVDWKTYRNDKYGDELISNLQTNSAV